MRIGHSRRHSTAKSAALIFVLVVVLTSGASLDTAHSDITHAVGAAATLDTLQFCPIVYRPPLVFGSILLEDGRDSTGGYAGEPMDIQADLTAGSVFGEVIEMRFSRLYGCADEEEMSQVLWIPFASEVAFTFIPPINWVTFYASVQFRDDLGHVSPIYCDAVSVEGMPRLP